MLFHLPLLVPTAPGLGAEPAPKELLNLPVYADSLCAASPRPSLFPLSHLSLCAPLLRYTSLYLHGVSVSICLSLWLSLWLSASLHAAFPPIFDRVRDLCGLPARLSRAANSGLLLRRATQPPLAWLSE